MLILPLIVSSIISSLAQLDAQSSGKMGVRALVYYFGTTILAAIVGIVLVLIIRPGTRSGPVNKKPNSKAAEGRTVDTVLDLFRYAFHSPVFLIILDGYSFDRNLFPENIMEAAFRSVSVPIRRGDEGESVLFSKVGTDLQVNKTWVVGSDGIGTFRRVFSQG